MTPAPVSAFLRVAWIGWLMAVVSAIASPAAEPAWRISPRETRDAARTTVGAQLAALKVGDLAKAYTFASTGIRRQFSLEVFAAMIRRGYPALLRQASAEIGIVRDDRGDRARVEVTVTDRLGRTMAFRYFLLREDDGWKVEGVLGDERPKAGDV
jgi:hypothetical protein